MTILVLDKLEQYKNMEAVLLSFVSFLSTLFGGLFALRNKDRLHLIMSLTAGVLLGVVFFDIMPEIFELTRQFNLDVTPALLTLVGGFLVIHVLEKLAILHSHHEEEYAKHDHKHPTAGLISAGGLTLHSFLDGVGIGLGFHVNPHVGFLVAIAVIAHDFSDGLNTVTLMLTHKNTVRKAVMLLLFDALAPILGALSTLLFVIPNSVLLLYLGFFAGFLLYISASDLLPEAHSKHSSWGMLGLTILGAAFIFVVTRLL
jgi:zinc transporter ZupT